MPKARVIMEEAKTSPLVKREAKEPINSSMKIIPPVIRRLGGLSGEMLSNRERNSELKISPGEEISRILRGRDSLTVSLIRIREVPVLVRVLRELRMKVLGKELIRMDLMPGKMGLGDLNNMYSFRVKISFILSL